MGVLFPIDRRKIICDLLLKSIVLVTLTVVILDTSAARRLLTHDSIRVMHQPLGQLVVSRAMLSNLPAG